MDVPECIKRKTRLGAREIDTVTLKPIMMLKT